MCSQKYLCRNVTPCIKKIQGRALVMLHYQKHPGFLLIPLVAKGECPFRYHLVGPPSIITFLKLPKAHKIHFFLALPPPLQHKLTCQTAGLAFAAGVG